MSDNKEDLNEEKIKENIENKEDFESKQKDSQDKEKIQEINNEEKEIKERQNEEINNEEKEIKEKQNKEINNEEKEIKERQNEEISNEEKEIKEKQNKEINNEEKENKESKEINNKEKVNNENSKNNNEKTQENRNKEDGFFTKLYNSIVKIEKYPDMAAQGLPKAISYITKLVVILAIVLCLGMVYQTHGIIQEGINYLQNEFPDFSYKEGTLTVNSEEPIIIEDSPVMGMAIIDTITEDENKVNEYITSIEQSGDGIVVLKDRVILKNISVTGTINYNYKDVLNQMQIQEFTKQDVINYANSTQIVNIYISVFITMFVYAFIMYFITTITNAILLSIFGYLTTWIAKIRMRYVAVFNMTIYALTLSIILNILYVAINIFINFNIEYFQVMYVAVAAIYLVAAIFILKGEFIKKQQELMKIAEVEAIVKQQLEREKEDKQEDEKREKEKKERKKKDKEQDGEQDKSKQEPEGSNA